MFNRILRMPLKHEFHFPNVRHSVLKINEDTRPSQMTSQVRIYSEQHSASQFFHDGGPYHMEPNPLIWGAKCDKDSDLRHERFNLVLLFLTLSMCLLINVYFFNQFHAMFHFYTPENVGGKERHEMVQTQRVMSLLLMTFFVYWRNKG